MKKLIKNIKLEDCLLYVVFIALMVTLISFKVFYHLDETLTYALSNHAGPYFMIPDEGVKKEPMEFYYDYLSVQPGNLRALSIPYINQRNDSHPPFYYFIIHIICGLIPRSFSRWQAGIVNIFFACATLFVFRMILKLLTNDKFIFRLLSWGFVFCAAILSETTFFRMYVMCIFLTTLLTYLFMWQLKKDRGIKFYALASFVVWFSSMTHYGTLIFSALICTTYGIYLLIHKKWKDVLYLIVSMAIAAACAIGFFPRIIVHVFGAGRGGESIGNLFNLSDLIQRISDFYGFFDRFMFGRITPLIIICLIVMLIMLKSRNKLNIDRTHILYYGIIFIPSIIYFLVSAKSAPYNEERYVSAIYAIVYAGVLTPLLLMLKKLVDDKKIKIISISFIVIMTLISFFGNGWQYLYRRKKPGFDLLNPYKENDCICIYDDEDPWRIQVSSQELTKYKGLTFINVDNIDKYDLSSFIDTDNVMIALIGIDDSYMNEVMKLLPQYNNYEYISERSFFVSK